MLNMKKETFIINMDLKRVYNIIISGGFYLSVEFWYKLDSSYTNKKLLNWVSNADAKFEKKC